MDATKHKFTAACVQLRAGRDVARNVDAALELIREAAGMGADLVLTPEQTALMELESAPLFASTVAEDVDPALRAIAALAGELGVWIIVGSIAIRVREDKVANRSFVISPDGSVVARYDKIHMFDVDLPGGESYRESKNYLAGNQAVAVDLPWGCVGLSICYDLRFPALYRALAQAGAHFLTVPAAFTETTGKAHWHTLLRARAIETGTFVLAAAQGGRHENGRDTYGHSMIVDPWGEIVVQAGIDPCVVSAEIDVRRVADARARIPALTHERTFTVQRAASGAGEKAAS